MSVHDLRTGHGRLMSLAGLVLLVAWPLVFSTSYDLRIFTLVGTAALMAIGFQFIFGHAGALALSQGAFFGFGGYTAALLSVKLGWSTTLTVPAAVAVALVLAAAIGTTVLRLGTHYLALATLGIGQVLLLVAVKWESLTGGGNGLPGVLAPQLAGIDIGRGWPLLATVWALVALGALANWQITRGLYGRVCHVMRENTVAAQSFGVDTERLRLELFLLSSCFAAAAGALQVYVVRVVSPEMLEFKVMVSCLAMVVIGGRTNPWGAVIGAFLVVQMPEWLRVSGELYLVLNGVLLLVLIVLAPQGITGWLDRFAATGRARPPAAAEPVASRNPHSFFAESARGLVLPSRSPVLQVAGISKSFGGVQALREVEFAVYRGEVLGVIGPNGSGKTSLVNCISGIYTPESGRVVLAGTELTGRTPPAVSRLGIARTFQTVRLVDDMSVLDNVAAARAIAEGVSLGSALLAGWKTHQLEAARGTAMQLLREMDLLDVADTPCGALAYGLKRRVEIARALAIDPLLILLDEPAAGLNETEQRELADRLERLASRGVTLVIVEHNIPFLSALATRLICLENGALIATGRPKDVYNDPRVIEAYMGRQEVAYG